ERETRLAGVEAELARRSRLASDLEAELAARGQRIESLEREVSSLAAEREEHLRSAKEAEAQIAGRTESAAVLQRELDAASARAQELEGDVRAAEDTIHRMEGELRSKSSRLEELAKASEEWRSTAETARRSLEEREVRIHRLEADAASSAALVGNIKQSLQRLEPLAEAAVYPAPEGATRLLVRTTGDSEVVHVLARRTTVGRTPDNDLQIDARFISRHHAVILAGPVQTIIEDLNSTNGVRVNGRRVTRQPLKDGDVVIIGKTRFRFAVRPAKTA
ncbi:MAG TPA: FHA domain-containing protein, partial [Steroidobacteraceae bacterium]|nr:FHA domain-containing protein [Steroidobacteraceae bacterium]